MNSSYIGFFLSFLVGGIIVWIFLRATFAKTRVPRAEFDDLNSSYRDSIVENVVLEGQISSMQGRVEELSEKLLKAEQDLAIANDLLKSMNEILAKKMNAQKTGIENTGKKDGLQFEEKESGKNKTRPENSDQQQ